MHGSKWYNFISRNFYNDVDDKATQCGLLSSPVADMLYNLLEFCLIYCGFLCLLEASIASHDENTCIDVFSYFVGAILLAIKLIFQLNAAEFSLHTI